MFHFFPKSRRLAVWTFITLLCLSVIGADTALADRGRPVFSEGTLLSDTGTPLRGTQYALDFLQGQEPPTGWIEMLPSRGINALHVYAESIRFTETGPGSNLAALDAIVDRAGLAGLYVVITIGGHPESPCFPDIEFEWEDFAYTFWKIYAGRYKDRTHVIYELQNEPWFFVCAGEVIAQPSPDSIIQFQAAAYRVARQKAPETPILLFSYAFLHSADGVRDDLARLDARLSLRTALSLDPRKDGVAFHGYTGADVTESVVREVTAPDPDCQGCKVFGVVETELQPCPTCGGALDLPLIFAHERTRTSWFSFLFWSDVNDANWNQVLDAAGVIWAADQGDWPGTSTPPLGSEIALFSPVGAGAYVRVDSVTGELIADATEITTASRFEVEPRGRYVALKSLANGKYVRTGLDLRLRADAIAPAEIEWVDLPDGSVTLQDESTWNLVTADYNFSVPWLMANRPVSVHSPVYSGSWERFQVEILVP